MNKADILSALKMVKPELENKYGLSSLALFGSYSREEQMLSSDIDLLVDFASVNADNFFGCVFRLEDLFDGKKVQVVTKEGIKSKYFEAIKPDLVYA